MYVKSTVISPGFVTINIIESWPNNFIEPSLTVELVQTPYYKLGQDSMMFIVTKPGLMTVDFTYMKHTMFK
jgi:hypothetical protein